MRHVTLHGYNVHADPLIDGEFLLSMIDPNGGEIVQLPLTAEASRELSRVLSGVTIERTLPPMLKGAH